MKKYYVYLHKRKDSGVVFYVGKGTGFRLNSSASRGKAWRSIVEESGFIPEVFCEYDTEQEALSCELDLISNPKQGWQLVNKRKTNQTLEISLEEVQDWLEYDPTSSTGLRWKKSKRRSKAGDEAGSIFKTKDTHYYSTGLNGKAYLNPRLVYLLCFGSIASSLVVNHKDNNGTNNKIENLELVSQAYNTRNTKRHKSEELGVNRRVSPTGAVDYVVRWTDDYGQHKKCFAAQKIGSEEEAKQLALAYRTEKIKELSSRGYGYLIKPQG
jgi:hypothetical protein